MPAEPTPSLLALPGELRNHIYRLAVVSKDQTAIRTKVNECRRHIDVLPAFLNCHHCKKCRKEIDAPPLALVCRQLYREIRPIFYEENTFFCGCRFCEEMSGIDDLLPRVREGGLVVQGKELQEQKVNVSDVGWW
ncbi:hypothetical protein LTR85_003391 [Meristemomyces frigidus]|nr:hypothetical protein LTR85_003391 [Meristemomyces frigidus]